MATYKVGDIVKFTAKFLQSTGWYTNVPIDGKVMGHGEGLGVNGREPWPKVQWSDSEEAVMVNPANIMLASAPDYSGM